MEKEKINSLKFDAIIFFHSLWIKNPDEGSMANFSNFDLSERNITTPILCFSSFRESSLKNSIFGDVDLSYADFRNANLQNADLSKAKLFECDFEGADLRGAKLNYSITNSYSLNGAKFLKTDFPWWIGRKDLLDIVFCDSNFD